MLEQVGGTLAGGGGTEEAGEHSLRRQGGQGHSLHRQGQEDGTDPPYKGPRGPGPAGKQTGEVFYH